ncbi:MAG TPA: hypothetical protein VG168_05410, partial [Bryobacteraceae bacterium]|nr:hypothetical protein [Bryobacteraceae bacterium]
AQLSTGPKSAEGKAKSSLNAVSTGLTGRTVLLPSEDAKAFSDHMANLFARFDPQTPEEQEIVQDLAHTKWRLFRVPQLEEDIYALGAVTFAKLFEEQPEEIRPGLIRAHTFVTHGKRFDNLYLQESRLTRRYQTLMKQLCDIRLKRQAEENERAAAARRSAVEPPEGTGRLVPVVCESMDIGFEFSNSPKTPHEPSKSVDPAPATRSKKSDAPWMRIKHKAPGA